MVEEFGRAVAPGPFVPTVIARGRHRGGRPTSRRRRGCCPGSPTARSPARSRSRCRHAAAGTVSGVGGRRARRRAGRRFCSSASVTTCWSSRSRRRRHRVTCRQPRSHPPSGTVMLDGAAGHGAARRRGRCCVDLARIIAVRRSRWCRPGVHRAGRRVRQGAGAVRPRRSRCTRRSSITAPTCWSPRSWRPRAVWDAARGRPRPASRRTPRPLPRRWPVRPPTVRNLNIQVHGGIGFTWEHDAHLLPAAGDDAAGTARAGRGGGRPDRSGPEGRGAGRTRSTCRRRRKQSARGPPFADGNTRPGRTSSSAARLIETGYVMPHWPKPWGRRRWRGGAAGHRAGICRAGFQATGVQHHRLGDPDPHPARDRRPGRTLGRPHCATNWSGASCSANRGPDRTPPASRPGDRSRAAGSSTVRRSGPAAPTLPAGPGHRAHRSERLQARGYHHADHRHARTGCRGQAATA